MNYNDEPRDVYNDETLDSISELSDEELWLPNPSQHALPSDETSPLVTIGIVDDWSFHDLRHTKEREEKLEWGAARPLLAGAKACGLVVPLAWLFERLSTARPDSARPVARVSRVPRDRRTLQHIVSRWRIV